MTRFINYLYLTLVLISLQLPTSKAASNLPVRPATMDTCYFDIDADGNETVTCIADDPWNDCGDGHCQ